MRSAVCVIERPSPTNWEHRWKWNLEKEMWFMSARVRCTRARAPTIAQEIIIIMIRVVKVAQSAPNTLGQSVWRRNRHCAVCELSQWSWRTWSITPRNITHLLLLFIFVTIKMSAESARERKERQNAFAFVQHSFCFLMSRVPQYMCIVHVFCQLCCPFVRIRLLVLVMFELQNGKMNANKNT